LALVETMGDPAKIDHTNLVGRVLRRNRELSFEIGRVRKGGYLRYYLCICCVLLVFLVGTLESLQKGGSLVVFGVTRG